MIAVSQNVDGGVRPIKPAKLYKCTQKHYATVQTRPAWTHGAGCARPWFRTAEPLGERRYENWIRPTLEFFKCVRVVRDPDKKDYWGYFKHKFSFFSERKHML